MPLAAPVITAALDLRENREVTSAPSRHREEFYLPEKCNVKFENYVAPVKLQFIECAGWERFQRKSSPRVCPHRNRDACQI